MDNTATDLIAAGLAASFGQGELVLVDNGKVFVLATANAGGQSADEAYSVYYVQDAGLTDLVQSQVCLVGTTLSATDQDVDPLSGADVFV